MEIRSTREKCYLYIKYILKIMELRKHFCSIICVDQYSNNAATVPVLLLYV